MNDAKIRHHLHRKKLRRSHSCSSTLVIDELGLLHGDCRADVAVVNGHLAGYEIKSDDDSLCRLERQVDAYSSVFDRVTIVTGPKHAGAVKHAVPDWWGLLVAHEGSRGGVSFETMRKGQFNPCVDPVSVAHLLWRDEAVRLLEACGVAGKPLRGPRRELYERLAELLSPAELRHWVRVCLKGRSNWRHPAPPSPGGGLCRPVSK